MASDKKVWIACERCGREKVVRLVNKVKGACFHCDPNVVIDCNILRELQLDLCERFGDEHEQS